MIMAAGGGLCLWRKQLDRIADLDTNSRQDKLRKNLKLEKSGSLMEVMSMVSSECARSRP